MILAVHGPDDTTARQLVAELRARGLIIETVLVHQLVFGTRWTLRANSERTTWEATFADGRMLASEDFAGLINRAILEPQAACWPTASVEDAEYGAQEWRAFLFAVLDGVPGPHINPSSSGSLAGPVWHPAEWRARAQAVGLEIAPETDGPTNTSGVRSVIVVGGDAFGDIDRGLAQRCVALSRSLNCPFQEIFFDELGRGVGGTALPRVTAADDCVLDALAALLSP